MFLKSVNRNAKILAPLFGLLCLPAVLNQCRSPQSYTEILPQGCPEGERPEPAPLAPGISGIVLTPGPRLLFRIDTRTSRRPLNWDKLVALDPLAYVELTIEIDSNGYVSEIARQCAFHEAAADVIWEAVRTWKYEKYKEGVLRFTFNAKASWVTIDARRMLPVSKYRPCGIRDGRLHYVVRNQRRFGVSYL